MNTSAIDRKTKNIGLIRSAGAIFYDTLLLFSAWFVVTALVVWACGGESIAPGDPVLTTLLAACAYFYFAGQWVRGGQTLGMKTWRIRLTVPGKMTPPSWSAATLRFVVATCSGLLFGLGYLWALWDHEGLTLPDRLSGTRRKLADD